jgi:prepilin-type N-terminal cleavage/methylation domain-containing protein
MQHARNQRHGMTLVELLVVVTILVILIAVAVPAMRPQLKDRKLREASRQLNTFIAVAKAKAIETGRPHGIAIARDPNNNDASFQIFLAETPIPFAGEFQGVKATLAQGAAPVGYAGQASFPDSQDLVKVGDFIQFDYKGPRYLISGAGVVGANKQVTFAPASGQTYPRLVNASGAEAPFQVFRQPVRSGGQPLTLPTGTVIDLAYSGIGYSGIEMAGTTGDIILTFTPGGSVDRLLNVPFTMPGTVHLLIGRTDQTPFLQPDFSKSNLIDGTTSWVSIGHLTGTVTTSENAFAPTGAFSASDASAILVASRRIAQEKQTMGGR